MFIIVQLFKSYSIFYCYIRNQNFSNNKYLLLKPQLTSSKQICRNHKHVTISYFSFKTEIWQTTQKSLFHRFSENVLWLTAMQYFETKYYDPIFRGNWSYIIFYRNFLCIFGEAYTPLNIVEHLLLTNIYWNSIQNIHWK